MMNLANDNYKKFKNYAKNAKYQHKFGVCSD